MASIASFVLVQFFLKNAFGFFQLLLSRGRQALSTSIYEILNHPDAGTDAFGTDLFAGHASSNAGRIFGEKSRLRMSRIGRHILHPPFLSSFFLRCGFHLSCLRLVSSAILQAGDTSMLRATNAAENGTALLDAVADHATAAMP